MKTIISIIILALAACRSHHPTGNAKGDPLPAEQLTVPAILHEESPQFCVTLDPQFSYVEYLAVIYDKKGDVLWKASNPKECWDGNVKKDGKVEKAPEGAYFVIIEIAATNGKNYVNRSNLVVVK